MLYWLNPYHLNTLLTEYVLVTHDTRGTLLFNTVKNPPESYRNYQAYIIGSEINTTVQLHFEFEGQDSCFPVIVEVSKNTCICLFRFCSKHSLWFVLLCPAFTALWYHLLFVCLVFSPLSPTWCRLSSILGFTWCVYFPWCFQVPL